MTLEKCIVYIDPLTFNIDFVCNCSDIDKVHENGTISKHAGKLKPEKPLCRIFSLPSTTIFLCSYVPHTALVFHCPLCFLLYVFVRLGYLTPFFIVENLLCKWKLKPMKTFFSVLVFSWAFFLPSELPYAVCHRCCLVFRFFYYCNGGSLSLSLSLYTVL